LPAHLALQARGDAPPQTTLAHHQLDARADERTADAAHGGLNFGQFRHNGQAQDDAQNGYNRAPDVNRNAPRMTATPAHR